MNLGNEAVLLVQEDNISWRWSKVLDYYVFKKLKE